MRDPGQYGIDIPRQIAWDASASQLVIANNSASHKLLTFYNLSGTQVFAIDTGLRNDEVAVSPDGHVAVSGATAFGTEQVQVYDNTPARRAVAGPIPFNGTTTSCGSTYIYGSGGGAVNSMTWLSNTKLLIALQVYNGSTATADNETYRIRPYREQAARYRLPAVSCPLFATTFEPRASPPGLVRIRRTGFHCESRASRLTCGREAATRFTTSPPGRKTT